MTTPIKYRISSTATKPVSDTVKGAPLTSLEIDGNFRSIKDSIELFQSAYLPAGYSAPVEYVAGVVLSSATQTVAYQGEVYAPKAAEVPFTTSGTFEVTKFVQIQSVASVDLASPTGGDSLIGTAAAPGGLWTTVRGFISTLLSSVGSSIVGYEDTNVQDVLHQGKPLANYSALRAYAGAATQVRITDPGIAGFFYYDSGDTTSIDNGGTIIVSNNGKRWKRIFDGAVNIVWFGAKSLTIAAGYDSTAAIQAAINSSNSIIAPIGVYKISNTLNFSSAGKTLSGEVYASSWSGGEPLKTTFIHSFNGSIINLSIGRHVIENIHFKSDGAYTGAGVTVGAIQTKIIKCGFYKLGGGAIKITGLSYGTYIEDNTFDACGGLGYYDIVGDVTGSSVTDYNTITHIEKNIFENSSVGAVSLKDSDPFYISKNYIEPYNSATTSPQIQIRNSSSGNSKGWICQNYIGSLTGLNGYAIYATGANISIESNECNYFPSGVYIESQNGVVSNNKIFGFSSVGINISSVSSGTNNNVTCGGNTLQTRLTGSVHGILLRGFVSGVTVSGNMINGKCDYYVRLLACSRSLIASNNIAPFSGDPPFGIGIYEDSTNTNDNAVKSNQIQAATLFNRSSFDYDILYRSVAPTAGTWKLNNIVYNSAPVAGGISGWVCVAGGTPGTWKSFGTIAA